jgi:uncharacterized protein
MTNLKPFVHLFKTLGNKYIFDVNTNAILKVDDDVCRYLENFIAEMEEPVNSLTDIEVQKAQAWIRNAQQQGFLSTKRAKQVRHYNDPYLEGQLSLYMGNLILQVTQACNLRCKYCAYSGDYLNRPHGELSMSEEIAKKAIDLYIDHSSEMPRLAFGFYGGEPFLNFDLIKKLIPYIKQKARGKKYVYNITTNGTIMNEEIIQFLTKNDINLMISLDGPKEVHDQNRCFGSGRGSFDVVMKNISKLNETEPAYVKEHVKFNAVITEEIGFCKLSKFFTDYTTIKDSFVLASALNRFNLKEDKKNQDHANLQYFEDMYYESFKYMLYKNNRLLKSDVSKIMVDWEEKWRSDMEEKRMPTIEVPDSFHPAGPCVPGSRRLFVTIDGELFPCERVSETSKVCRLGTIDTGIDMEKAKKILNIGRITEKACINCWASRFCGSCVASADNGKEMDKNLKLTYCKMFLDDAEAKLRKYCTYKEFNISTEKQIN